MATAVTKATIGGAQGLDSEIHYIDWDGTDATEELTVGLSTIYFAILNPFWGAATAAEHTPDDGWTLEIDETVDSSGYITVTSNAVTVLRTKNVSAGTLASGQSQVVLFGKSG